MNMISHLAADGIRAAGRQDRYRQQVAERAAQLRQQVAVRSEPAIVRQREPIDGSQVLRWNYAFLERMAVWGSEHELVTCALWDAATHARHKDGTPVWQYCPRLGIFGPSGSGKSWKARLVGKLAYRPEILVEPTKPAFIDLCADHHTVIMTEADETFRSPGRSRGILACANASYEPDRSAAKIRGGVAIKIPLFTFVVWDAIDTLLSANRPDLKAMISRTLIIRSRIAPAGFRPPRMDGKARAIAEQLARVNGAWMAQEVEDGIGDEIPGLPEHVGNRAYALWEPLAAVALRADKGDPDGPWSTACRAACEHLEAASAGDEDDMSELDRQMAEWGI